MVIHKVCSLCSFALSWLEVIYRTILLCPFNLNIDLGFAQMSTIVVLSVDQGETAHDS